MKKLFLIFLLCLCPAVAQAASCSAYSFTLQNNTTADATQVMSNFNTVRNCVINNAAGSGVNTDITSLTGLTTPLSNAQGGTATYIGGTSGGSANAQTVATLVPDGWSLTTGYRLTFTAGVTNTGATTLSANSGTATAVRKIGQSGLEALTGGEIVAGNIVEAIYNGTFYVLLSTPYNEIGPATTLSSAAPDLGTIPSHNVSISGTTTITSFGSTAVTTAPVYLIKFTGALTLTYNATSLIIPGAANITTAANDTATVEYLGSGNWQVLQYTRVSGAAIIPVSPLCGATGFTMANNSGTPNTSIDMAADQVVMLNTSGVPISGTGVSVTVNAATTGANALDTGGLGATTWYNFFLINNGTTTAGLASLSATAPTMPSGYTYKCRLGAMITDGASVFMRIQQRGNLSHYKVTAGSNTLLMPLAASGAAGSNCTTNAPTYANVSLANYVPPTATMADLVLSGGYNNGAGATVMVAPSTAASGGSGVASTNPPPMFTTSANLNIKGTLFLETAQQVSWCSSNTGGGLQVDMWRDKVNAN